MIADLAEFYKTEIEQLSMEITELRKRVRDYGGTR